ncbi:hypothetical protein PanWU01x14_150750 [Parasponia andersonii]|uniref:Uncharacterized protein n=1 Tax=Parasponia andersonii TaxID=3476 RepID=A0A2P5CHZ2_PARAD|nr:hypothetical protein PanWU01x14_150750 [Parasponia andersonii]
MLGLVDVKSLDSNLGLLSVVGRNKKKTFASIKYKGSVHGKKKVAWVNWDQLEMKEAHRICVRASYRVGR